MRLMYYELGVEFSSKAAPKVVMSGSPIRLVSHSSIAAMLSMSKIKVCVAGLIPFAKIVFTRNPPL